jgi:hypothetical protein
MKPSLRAMAFVEFAGATSPTVGNVPEAKLRKVYAASTPRQSPVRP